LQIHPRQDAQRAMRLIRSGRVASRIDPARIGVLGFSAGGHVAAMLALMSQAPAYVSVDAADLVPPNPDFAALIYAAYLDGRGSPALLGGKPGAAPDLATLIDMTTPPVFLAHAADDATVPVEGSQRMHDALKAAGAPAELHVFPDGGHGFGIARAKGREAEKWPDLFLAWGRARRMFR
jgi:acetyl esterase/lipase